MNNTKAILEAQQYEVSLDRGVLVLKRKSNNQMLLGLSLVFGLLFSAMSFFNPGFLLFAVGSFAAPWLGAKWKYPKVIRFDKKFIELEKNLLVGRKEQIALSTLEELQIEKATKNSDTSPFKEGYQDFYYNIQLKTTSKRKKLLYLKFRKEADAEVDEVRKFLKNYIRSIKP